MRMIVPPTGMTLALMLSIMMFPSGAKAAPRSEARALDNSGVPLPPAEATLPARVAGRPVAVPGATRDLEGPVYLANGDLLFSDVQGHRILRLDREGRIASVASLAGLMPGGMALGPDGRLYVAAANYRGGGAVISMTTDGSERRTILAEEAGFTPNDLVFDAHGGFYFTDARGTVGDAAGGVWYVAPGQRPVPVIRHIAVANGIALSPDGRTLWVGEFALGRLYRIDMKDAVTPAPYGATTAYHFIGPAPDSMRTDAQGRVYVALYGQGRVLIFAPAGIPIGQILLPGRDAGRNLHSTSLALRRGTGEIAIVTSDGTPDSATIFHLDADASSAAQRVSQGTRP